MIFMNKIKSIENNIEKKQTYAILNKKNKIALENNEYETVILLSYSMIEDRLLSFLHYLGVINRNNTPIYPDDYIDSIIRPLLKYKENVPKERVYKLNNISTKIKIIKLFLKNAEDRLFYIKDCNSIIEKNIGIKDMKKFLSDLSAWIKIRNEIVHASFNKNINDLDINIELSAKEGYKLAKLISSYTNKIKTNKMQVSVRDKWLLLSKVVNNDYLFNICVQYDIFNSDFSLLRKEVAQVCKNIKIIKEKIDIVDTISKYISVEQKGKNYFAICPFHTNHDFSLAISSEKKIYRCFACRDEGDIINFIMKSENKCFSEVYRLLCKKLNLEYNISNRFINLEEKFMQFKINNDDICNSDISWLY